MAFLSLEGILAYQFGKPGGHRGLKGAAPSGWPDLLVILPPDRQGEAVCYIHVELKVEGGWLTRTQALLHGELKAAGCNVHVVDSLEEIAALLEAYGHPVRTRVGIGSTLSR